MAPPAVISHTSLPSQTGPMVLIRTRRSPVVAAEHGQQHADAEVEALEEEVAGPQHGDQQEPEGGEFHVGAPSVGEGERALGVVGVVGGCGDGSPSGSRPWRSAAAA